jgi:hypothetical protein
MRSIGRVGQWAACENSTASPFPTLAAHAAFPSPQGEGVNP